jgi:hypothetical protein
MLAQFQSLYPNGSIISELIQIFQGKYIVRVSVQIESVTRATGMAAADTVEVAEDQARSRALMVLGIGNTPVESVAFAAKLAAPVQVNPALSTGSVLNESAYSSIKNEDFVSGQWSAVNSKDVSVIPVSGQSVQSETVIAEPRSASQNDTYNQDFSHQFSLHPHREAEFDPPVANVDLYSGSEPENQSLSGITASNVTPFTPRNYSSPENVDTPIGTSKKNKRTTPVDLSDVIAKTDVELQRLSWTPEQGREHLIKTYGKRGRTLLTEEELHGFLKYLESQPTPIDPLTGF